MLEYAETDKHFRNILNRWWKDRSAVLTLPLRNFLYSGNPCFSATEKSVLICKTKVTLVIY
jgi:hypothetical protein